MPRRSALPCGFDLAHATIHGHDLADVAYWGYRLVVHPDGTHFVHEVYYDRREGLLGLSLAPARPCGDTAEEVREGWGHMQEAFGQPPLRYADFTTPTTHYRRYADEPTDEGGPGAEADDEVAR